jgi:hypothetical protein
MASDDPYSDVPESGSEYEDHIVSTVLHGYESPQEAEEPVPAANVIHQQLCQLHKDLNSFVHRLGETCDKAEELYGHDQAAFVRRLRAVDEIARGLRLRLSDRRRHASKLLFKTDVTLLKDID